MMPPQGTIQAFFNQALAGSGNRIDTGGQSGGDLAVAPSLAGVRRVGFQRIRAFSCCRAGCFPFLIITFN